MNLAALYQISYGLYIVSARLGEKLNGQIANTVFQICSEPPILAVSINKSNLTHKFISESEAFCVSILSKQTPLSFIGRFGYKSGRDTDKFDGVGYRDGASGSPIVLDHTIGYVDAKVEQQMDVATHTIFIGRIVDADVVSEEPMTYAYYHQLKSGVPVPAGPARTAPTTNPPPPEADAAKDEKFDLYRCALCGYIYDSRVGDPDAGIAPGTLFADLPDDWVCPICGATKDDFVKEH